MTDYAPTTEAIRGRIIRRGAGWGFYGLAEFDRWLSEHDRQVAERAWDEGRASASIMLPSYPPQFPKNPYRKEQS